jgi:WhiB family redox-sensing transcriptional regulator
MGDLFFSGLEVEIDAAKSICRGCRLRRGCLELALDRGEPWGVWGGELLRDGAVIARPPRVGRPKVLRPAS